MHLISNRSLRAFALRFPQADAPLQAWRRLIERNRFTSFAELKGLFPAVDKAGDFFVFNVGGNKFRVIAAIHFNTQTLYVRHVFTHAEYDDWRP
jgi:mRNA interferase HigB